MTDPIETIDITNRLRLHHNTSWTGEAHIVEIVPEGTGHKARDWFVPAVRLYSGYLAADPPQYTDGTLVPLNVVARVVAIAATEHAHSLIAIAMRDGLIAARKMLAP